MTLLIIYLSVAIIVSFICSLFEAVLLSVNPAYIANLRRKNVRGSKALEELKSNLDRPIAAILTLNTIAHTVGAAGVGAQATIVFGSEYLGVVSAVLTFLILVFSEIIPKTIGATYWQSLAPRLAIVILWLTKVLYPFVWLSEKLTRMFSKSGKPAFTFSRDELEALAEIGVKEGGLDIKELRIVRNLLRLRKLLVRDIMTPRSVIFAVQQDMTVREFFAKYSDKPFSRIPIYDKNLDDITGYVLKNDLLVAQAKDQFERRLYEFKRSFIAVPDSFSVSRLFDLLIHERSHIALVVDEYGTLRGLVTLEDIIETLIGLEITDELDTVEDMQMLARKMWEERVEALGIDPQSLTANSEKNDFESENSEEFVEEKKK